MAKHKIEKTDNSHLMVHPEGRGKVLAIRGLLGLLALLIIALLFIQFFPNLDLEDLRLEPKREASASNGKRSETVVEEGDKPKRYETYNDDAVFKWEEDTFQELEMGKITSEELLETFGQPYLVRRLDDELTLVYQDQPEHNRLNPQRSVILGFNEKDGNFILSAKSSKNLTRPFENNKTDETPPVWTKDSYQQLPISHEADNKKGIAYEELVAKYDLPFDLLVWDEQTLHSSRQTLHVRYFHETKEGDDVLSDYVNVNLVFEQDKDGIYYLVEKSSLEYD